MTSPAFPSDPPVPAADDNDNPSPFLGGDANFFDHFPPDFHFDFRPPGQRDSPYPSFTIDDLLLQPPPPSPPLANFLDTILNPAQLDHGRYSPFVYRPSPPRQSYTQPEMPPRRPARLPNGYVDLTATPDTPPMRRRRRTPTPGPSAKRQKRSKDSDSGSGNGTKQTSADPADLEQVDLTDDKQLKDVLQKQREDAIKSQTKIDEPPTTFNSFTCVICMDTPTDLTATACGHLFCHTCLMEALIAGENRSGPGEPKRSQCPVCRKNINRTKASDIIPLSLKKGLATQPRKKASAVPVPAKAPAAKAKITQQRPAPPPSRRLLRQETSDSYYI